MLALANHHLSIARPTKIAASKRFRSRSLIGAPEARSVNNLCSVPLIDTLLEIGTPVRDVIALTSIAKGDSIADDGRGPAEQQRAAVIGAHTKAIVRYQADLELLAAMLERKVRPAIVQMLVHQDYEEPAIRWSHLESLSAGVTDLVIDCTPRLYKQLQRVLLAGSSDLRRLTFVSSRNVPFATVNLPNLTHLKFGDRFNRPLAAHSLPPTLKVLIFGHDFNQALHNVTLPPTLTHLTFGDDFDHSLDHVTLPPTLTHLSFGCGFNQPLDNTTLPATLTHLTFGAVFNQSLNNVTLPATVTHLTFGRCFNQPLDNVTLPMTLTHLEFGDRFAQPLQNVKLPATLSHLHLHNINCLPRDATMSRLTHLTIAGGQSLDSVTLPPTLTHLTLAPWFNHSLENVTLSPVLTHLTLSQHFNQSFDRVTLPATLTHLTLGCYFTQSFDNTALPSTLRCLVLPRRYNQSLSALPAQITVLRQ